MRFLKTLGLIMTIGLSTTRAAEIDLRIYPQPQGIKALGGTVSMKSIKLSNATKADKDAVALLKTVISPGKIAPKGYRILIGEINDKTLTKYAAKVKQVSGAYYLSVKPNGAVIAGFDGIGTYYGVQTLRQLLKKRGRSVTCPTVEISDYPDIPLRGSVEGFYGAPWKHSARLSQIEFYGKWKLNTYIYGPKDDPYHAGKWRQNYPEAEAKKLKELATVSAKNKVDFVWAIHLGASFNTKDKAGEFKKVLSKLEFMYGLGVRIFAVFFDDFGGSDANLHVEICNYIDDNFVKKKPDSNYLIMCPNQYNRAWSGGDYLDILAKLNKNIHVMWTGNKVCCDITEEGTNWINNRIQRKSYIWWNWPVMDYCRTALLMGRTYGLEKGNRDKLSGFTSNPMDKPEASKVALFGVADWCWNVDDFDSEKSWKDSIKIMYPQCAKEMQTFVNHNSDQGESFHGYRREESVEFKPILDEALKQYQATGKFEKATADQLKAEFKNMVAASDKLIKVIPKINAELFHEIEYWIRGMGELGRAGLALVDTVNSTKSSQKPLLLNRFLKYMGKKDVIYELQKERAANDTTPGDRKWVKGCKIAGKHVVPFLLDTFYKELGNSYEALSGKTVKTSGSAEEYKIVSNVSSLAKIPVSRKNRDVTMNQNFESHKFKNGQFVGMLLPEGFSAERVILKFDNTSAASGGILEGSIDGKAWEKIVTTASNGQFNLHIPGAKGYRAIRFVNKSGNQQIKITEFKVIVPANCKFNSTSSIVDGNVKSCYSGKFSKGQTIKIPARGLPKASKYVLFSSGDFSIKKKGNQVTIRSNANQSAKIFELVAAK